MTDSSPGPNRGRRRYLATVAAGAFAGLAGCDGDSGDAGTPTTTRTEPDPTETAPASATDGATDPTPTETGEPAGDWREGGPPDRDGWSVAFADRFEGGELDETKWGQWGGMGVRCAGGALECWDNDERVRVDAETDRLVIETVDEPAGDREYSSGAINTRDALTQEFGYFEAKSRAPAVPGGLPAFWMWWNPDDWGHRREIDFYEINGVQAKEPVHSVHVDCERRTPGEGSPEWRGGRSELSTGADERFHVWGCEWTPESVTFYVDGEATVRVEDDIVRNCLAGEELWIVLSTHVNEDMGDPTEADYPYTHEFEWVRAWQRDGWA